MRKLISRMQSSASGQGTSTQRTDDRGTFIPFVTDPETIEIFVSMLRNNLQRANGFRIDVPPAEAKIHDYVKSVVTAFLHGASGASDVTRLKGSEVTFQKELAC